MIYYAKENYAENNFIQVWIKLYFVVRILKLYPFLRLK